MLSLRRIHLIGRTPKCSDAKGRMAAGFNDHWSRTQVQDWGKKKLKKKSKQSCTELAF